MEFIEYNKVAIVCGRPFGEAYYQDERSREQNLRITYSKCFQTVKLRFNIDNRIKL